MGYFSASPGAIYPALRRLEEAGLVKGTVENASTLRPRMAYALTLAGRAALKSALSRPVTREDVIRRIDTLILRFSFMDGLLPKERTFEFLRSFWTEIEACLEVLEKEARMNARWAKRTHYRLIEEHAGKGETK